MRGSERVRGEEGRSFGLGEGLSWAAHGEVEARRDAAGGREGRSPRGQEEGAAAAAAHLAEAERDEAAARVRQRSHARVGHEGAAAEREALQLRRGAGDGPAAHLAAALEQQHLVDGGGEGRGHTTVREGRGPLGEGAHHREGRGSGCQSVSLV